MSKKTYEVLRIISSTIAPISGFVACICAVFKVPVAAEIAAIFTGLDIFIGQLVDIARKEYQRLHPVVYADPEEEK